MNKTFKIVKKGYDPNEVNSYINWLENVIEKYKNQESTITKAILQAQLTAENIIEKANIKASNIEKDTIKQLADIRLKTTKMKNKLENFQKEYNRLIQDYLVTIRSDELVQLFNNLDDIIDFLAPEQEQNSYENKEINISSEQIASSNNER